MKKLVAFLAGLLLLGMTGMGIYFAGGIFDAGRNNNVFPFFFQPNSLSTQRPGVPQTPEYMGDAQFMDLLVRKFITEYFYAAPDVENIAQRTKPGSILYRISSAPVFDEWIANEAKNILELAQNKAMRTAHVIDSIFKPNGSQYWVVNYELKTWEKPNDFNVTPTITRGTMYMDIHYEMGMRTDVDIETLHEYLEDGGDPAAIFNFSIVQIIQG